uniref:Uncharacterized protein n=1 Tax=Rhizophora mucronata TaxID=61149 RepID=A0A2P2P1W7_RHIMU
MNLRSGQFQVTESQNISFFNEKSYP